MANFVFGSLPLFPGVLSSEVGQITLIDISTNIALAANSAFELSLARGAAPQTYPSAASSISAGNILQQDRRAGPVLLGSVTADLSVGTKTTIFTVPASRICIPTLVIMRAPNSSLATASVSFGFNAAATDVVANATHTGLTGTTTYIAIQPIGVATTASVRGAAADVFGVVANTTQAAATCICELIGYLVAA